MKENESNPGLSLEKIREARVLLRDITRLTPMIGAPKLGGLSIKAENLQLTGSFKLRGAYYKLSRLSGEELDRGIIACSAGNHAQGVAFAAARMGARSIICMPESAPLSKIESTTAYGGEIVLVPGVYDDAYKRAIELSGEKGYTFVHGFDDGDIITGQGTIGLEILDQMPDVETVAVPIGGGGLISGIAYVIKTLRPGCRVVGVQAAGAPGMLASRLAGRVSELESVSTIADGIAIKRPGALCFDCCERYVDDIVTVTEEEISTAILTLMEDNKTVAEGAGAAAVAAAMFGKAGKVGPKTVCVVSGGNIDVNILSRVITQGLVKTGRITEFTSKVVDKPHMLVGLLDIVGNSGANILEIDHNRQDRKAGLNYVVVHMELETRNAAHSEELLRAVVAAGYDIY